MIGSPDWTDLTPIDDDYVAYQDDMDRQNDPLDTDYVRDEYRYDDND